MSTLTPKELNQLSEETSLSKISIQDWYKRFNNECPSGSLSKERFIHLYRSFYPRARNSDSYAHMFFTTFDDDRDQALNFREFLRVVAITQGSDDKAKLELAYKAYNRNQLETNLSRKHFHHVLMTILDLIETRDEEENDEEKRQMTTEWVMKGLGLDEKTEISKREFVRRCRENPSLYEFLAFFCVPKPNCADGDLRGKEKYQITIQTGPDGKNISGTNVNVYLIVHGEQSDSEPIQLQNSHTHKDPFGLGNTDIFTQFFPPLGEIKGATLWHTGDGHQSWYVEHLTIINEKLNTTTYFPIQRWLDPDEYDKVTKIHLIPNQAPGYNQ